MAERTGTSFIALNPLHAIANRQPYNTSPYLPNSIFYRNPIYLDIEAIPDFARSSRAAALFQSPGVQKEIAALRDAELVEYERVYALKLRFLKLLFQAFLDEWRDGTPRAAELKHYIEREGDLLHRFAVHSALDQNIHKQCPDVWNWRGWPEQYQDPESAATREFARKHWRSVLFYQIRPVAARSAAGGRAAARSRARLEHRALSRPGAGHRPVRFRSLGASRILCIRAAGWARRPTASRPKARTGAFRRRTRTATSRTATACLPSPSARIAGMAERCASIMSCASFGCTGFQTAWKPPKAPTCATVSRTLLSILALESVRNRVIVIGEDLGTVPDEAREVLHRFGILSYRLLYFEQDNGRFRRPQDYPRDALVSATTHDLPTLAGFWLARDIDARREAGLLPDDGAYQSMRADRAREKQKLLDLLIDLKLLPDWFPRDQAQVPELTGELHNAIVGFLASAPSKLMVLNQEDLLKQAEQQNLPGSTAEYPNWRRKMKCTVEELWTSGEIQDFAKMFHLWLERSGRLNVPGAGAV